MMSYYPGTYRIIYYEVVGDEDWATVLHTLREVNVDDPIIKMNQTQKPTEKTVNCQGLRYPTGFV